MIWYYFIHIQLSPGLTCTIVTAGHKQLIGAFPAGCERQTRKWTKQCNVSELVPYPLSNPNYNFVYCACFKLTCSFTSLHLHFLATFPNVGEETAFGSHSRVWTFLNTELCERTHCRKPFLHCVFLWAELFPHWTCDNRACKSPLFFFFLNYRMACLNMQACLKTWMGILSVTIGFVWWQLLNTPSAPPSGYLKHPSDVYPPTA